MGLDQACMTLERPPVRVRFAGCVVPAVLVVRLKFRYWEQSFVTHL
jgi:hypothetical protein